MPFVSVGRIAKAIENLQRFHAFFGVTLLSMKKSGVSTGAPIAWGQAQENELLDTYYSPPGAPPDKPYFVPFWAPKNELWKNPKYSGGVLQRARTTDTFKDVLNHPSPKTWAFVDNYVPLLQAQLPTAQGEPVKLPVFDLIAWLYRDIDLPANLSEVEAKFRNDFALLDDVEYFALFDNKGEDANHFFFSEPVDKDDLIRLVGGVPEGPSLGERTEEELIAHIERWMRESERLSLPDGYVRAFYFALKTQRFVVLSGRPGTGKTAFARAFTRALADFFPGAVAEIEVSIAQEFSEADVIGYEKIAGDLAATELTKKLFLSGRPRDIYVVILDEMNLAQVDYYFGRLLPAIESDSQVELPGTGGLRSLPADTFVVGTVNSYMEEVTRLPLSGPVKRRANVIEMPNYLQEILREGDRVTFNEVARDLLKQTEHRVKSRQQVGTRSVLDSFRQANLASAAQASSTMQDPIFVDTLWQVCEICSTEALTGLTFGVLQDVLDYVAMADADVMRSLDRQIAQKIAPQLNGPASVVRRLLQLLDQLEDAGYKFSESRRVLTAMLSTEDVGSGMVTYMY